MGEEGFDRKYGHGLLNLDFDTLVMAVEPPCFLTESGSYEESMEVVLQSPSGADIWYYFEGSNETPQKYTEPVLLENSQRIYAWCEQGGVISQRVRGEYYIGSTLMEAGCTIDSYGIITKYTGTQEELTIPETVNGITVTGIKANTISKVINKVSRPENGNGFFVTQFFPAV